MYRSEIENVLKDKMFFKRTANRVKLLNVRRNTRGGIRL